MQALPPPPPAYAAPAPVATVQYRGFSVVPYDGGTGSFPGEPRAYAPDAPRVYVPGGDDPPPAAPPAVEAPRLPSKPQWILVVPVEYAGPGRASWGRGSAWSREWMAPVRRGGMRLVATMGDADDRDRMGQALLADPDLPRAGAAAVSLARKYGAPAVALVQLSGSGTRTWLWRSSGGGPETGEGGGSKEDALAVLVSLAAPAETAAASAAQDRERGRAEASEDAARAAAASGEADLEEHPEYGGFGRFGFSVIMDGKNLRAASAARKAVEGLPGVLVLEARSDRDGLEISGSVPGERSDMERALAAAGVRLSRD